MGNAVIARVMAECCVCTPERTLLPYKSKVLQEYL
jgi:hypothetical protein